MKISGNRWGRLLAAFILGVALFFLISGQSDLEPALSEAVSEDSAAQVAAPKPIALPTELDVDEQPSALVEKVDKIPEGIVALAWPKPWQGAVVLDSKIEPVLGASNSWKRTAILKAEDYPKPIRVEETIYEGGGEYLVKGSTVMVSNQVLVSVDPSLAVERIEEMVVAANGRVLRSMSGGRTLLIQLNEVSLEGVPDAVSSLNKGFSDHVKIVEPDYMYSVDLAPNDPSYSNGDLWGLNNYGQSGGEFDLDIDAPEAWDKRTDASEIIVGVIDTGIRYTHVDLIDNMWTNPNEVLDGVDNDGNGFIDDIYGIDAVNNDGDPMDDHGHGTHCAGTIGGVGDNGIGVVGVAWNVKLMGLKFLSAGGSGSSSDAIICVDYAVDMGVKITSNSWGGGSFSNAMQTAIENAEQAGMIFVAAAGNSTVDNDSYPHYPSSYSSSNIVAVASSTRTGELSSFSNWGQESVDIVAPGSSIYSTYADSDTSYDFLSGTSMATPHVSGALALLMAEYPDEPLHTTIDRLYGGGANVSYYAGKILTGRHLNVANSLELEDVVPFPRIINGLISQSVELGESFTLSVEVSADVNTYEWYLNDQRIGGESSSSLTVTNADASDSGTYRVDIVTEAGVVSSAAQVYVRAPDPAIAEALDTPDWDWYTYGDGVFSVISLPTSVGGTAIQSQNIVDNQSVTVETTVEGPGLLLFDWKVRSESGWDYFIFYDNGVEVDAISGPMDWQAYSYELSSGTHVLKWVYDKDVSVSTYEDNAGLDNVRLIDPDASPPVFVTQPSNVFVAEDEPATLAAELLSETGVSLQWEFNGQPISGANQLTYSIPSVDENDVGAYRLRATNTYGTTYSDSATLNLRPSYNFILNANQDSWNTTGNAEWSFSSTETHDGEIALESPSLIDNQYVEISTTVTGPSEVSFWWKASTESGWDYFVFRMDNVMLGRIAGEVDWTYFTIDIPEGTHTLSWAYEKDASVSHGFDTVWLDEVTVTGEPELPVIVEQPQDLGLLEGGSGILKAAVTSIEPVTYQWFKDDEAIVGATDDIYRILSASDNDLGEYYLTATNTAGSVTTDTIKVFYLPSIAEGTDNFDLYYRLSRLSAWIGDVDTTQDAVDSIVSYNTADRESSWVETIVAGEGELSFWWKVSSEADADYLRVHVNGDLFAEISGEVDWEKVTIPLEDGNHWIRWEYVKDIENKGGEDRGWLDQVVYTGQGVGDPFANWANEHSLTAEQSGYQEDPDKDGVKNLIEYAFGMNPTVQDAVATDNGDPGMPFIKRRNGKIVMRYIRNLNAAVRFDVETSTNMVNYTSSGVRQEIDNSNANFEIIDAEVDVAPGEMRFLNIKIDYGR